MAIAARSLDHTVIDRWFYTFLSLLFVATAVVGFTPNSLAILSGTKATPPILVHFHAAIMAGWLLLLFSQAALMANGQGLLHRRLGVVSFVLAPTIVVVMTVLAITMHNPEFHSTSIGFIQVRRIILFSSFYLWAILSRKSAPETHKRMQFWATLVLLDAAIFRMTWLTDFGADNVIVSQSYQLLLMLPALAYDIVRFGRPHKANLVGFSLMLVTMIVASALW